MTVRPLSAVRQYPLIIQSPAPAAPRLGRGRRVIVVVAHADDVTLFCGGTVARWADLGVAVTVVRVTDDSLDSAGVDEATTRRCNAEQFRAACEVLGVEEVVDLGWLTDRLSDESTVAIRERIIYHVRRVRPFAMASFDPDSRLHEDNLDHKVVAAAVDEAYWTSMFDKHHPEHLDEGLRPHGVYERWYFGRQVADVTEVVDISTTIDRKVEAALCHDLMLRNIVHQLRLQAETGGYGVAALDAAQDGDLRPLFDTALRRSAEATGARHGLAMAEEFRVVPSRRTRGPPRRVTVSRFLGGSPRRLRQASA